MQALIYPISIIIVTILMITTIMIYVIPKIEAMYKESNVNLPELTLIIISISHFFTNYIIFICLWSIIFIYTIFLFLKIKIIKLFFDKQILNLPIFWNLIRKKILINFSEFLATLLVSWIMINKALMIIKKWTSNLYYAEEYENILSDIKNGKTLSDAMWWNLLNLQNKKNLTTDEKIELTRSKKRVALFPIELSTWVKIWEQTWTLSKMLFKSSARYSKEVDNVIKNISSLMEPIIIVVIWWIVGTIILWILLPFLGIANVIK